MNITPIVANRFLSDGGVMFGLVPRAIWEQFCPPDEKNRIPQNANILMIESDDGRLGLIDSGCGDAAAYTDKALKINGLGSGWPLIETLADRGIDPEQIDFVILTHLHWDHASGMTRPDGRPTFPNAELIVPRHEWNDAHSDDPLLYKAYPKECIDPLNQYKNKHLIEPGQIFEGIELIETGGHTRGHCAVLLTGALSIHHPESPKQIARALFLSDACPTSHHLRMVFHPSYDLYPLQTRAWKRAWLPQCANDGTWLFFSHDPHLAAAQISHHEKSEFVTSATLKIK